MPPKRSNLDWYADWITALESVFGLKWLEKKQRQLETGSKVHPVVGAWCSAKCWIAAAKATGQAEITPELASFFDMGRDLHVTRHLHGFAQAFIPRRLKGDGWENDVYVAHVAALALSSGYDVTYVPTSQEDGVRTADLCMSDGERSYFVECKKKDQYIRPADAQSAWSILEDGLAPIAAKIAVDYEVVVACVGKLSHEAVPSLIAAASSVIERADSGKLLLPEFDSILLIKKQPPRPVGVDGAWLAAWQNPGSAIVKLKIGADGEPQYGSLFRTCLYVLDAHRSAQILASLRDARSQIPQQMSGVIFVAVDTSGIAVGDHDLYFSSLSSWLERELRRSDNSRVLAVVLTGGIAQVEITSDHGFHRSQRHWCVVRNPNAPSEFRVPGE